MKKNYLFSFRHGVTMNKVRDSLFLAALATESVFGRSLFRMEATFRLETHRRTCFIDASTPVGRMLACILNGFLTSQFGERAFHIRRVSATTPA